MLFTGDLNDDFLVIDVRDGKTLYRFNAGGSICGGVISYQIGDKQYVATTSRVISGFFGSSGTSAVIIFALPRARDDCLMDASGITTLAALMGAAVGGLTSGLTSWLIQKTQMRTQWLAQEKLLRQELYKEFIEEASQCYIDALQHDKPDIPALIGLYAKVARMRVLSSQTVLELRALGVTTATRADALPHVPAVGQRTSSRSDPQPHSIKSR